MNRATHAAVIATFATAALLTGCTRADVPTDPELESSESPAYTATELPFQLDSTATGVAIDNSGNIYASDVGTGNVVERDGYSITSDSGRLLVLRSGADHSETLVEKVGAPFGLAAAPDGTLYATDAVDDKLLRIAPGGSQPETVELPADVEPEKIAVNSAGDVAVLADDDVYLLRGGLAPAEMFDVFFSSGDAIAVSENRDIYFTDTFDDLYLVEGGAGDPRELRDLGGDFNTVAAAFDPQGVLYFIDRHVETTTSPDGLIETNTTSYHVRTYTEGADETSELAIAGLTNPTALTVDDSGAVYIADNSRIVKFEKP